jgi:DNA-binding GntR family transcriptional regulator
MAASTKAKGTSKPNSMRPARPVRGTGGQVVHETLQREILSLTLPPGAPLDETQLARRFGLSRSPVREALNRLSAQNLVVMLPNRSTLVAPVDMTAFPRYVEALDLLQRITTRLAAEHRTEADIAEMKRRADLFRRGGTEPLSGAPL